MAAARPTTTRTAQETPTPTPASPNFAVDPEGDVKLTLEAIEHVWVRVTVDGMTAYQGLLGPEQTETWVGSEAVIVDTGNGAGLLVIVNEQDQGPLGERAQICIRGWGPEGEIAVQ